MDDSNILDKIKAYLEGRLPGEEHEEIKTWIRDNREDSRVVDILSGHWELLPEYDDTAGAKRAFERFGRTAGGLRTARKPALPLFMRHVRNVAAVLAVPLFAAGVVLFTQYAEPEPDYVERFVPQGQKDSVLLPDNTVVWLNSGSRIIYPERFGRKVRKVFVSGEAFFDVAEEPGRPFVLTAGDVKVRVLGTQFNVTSYEDMQHVTVSLLEGAVAMDALRDGVLHSATLSPGDVASYDKQTGFIERSQFSTDAYLKWRNGGFYFRNQNLSEITAQFERVFSVKIFIDSPELRRTRYSLAFVNGESLGQMLDAINFNGNMHITVDRDMIFITSKHIAPME